MSVKSSQFRWVVVFLLFLVCVINYIDRASIAYAIDLIAAEHHFSHATSGLILGAFGIGYIITSLLGGMAADRYGAKRTLFVAAFLWSLSTYLFSIASGFMMFFLIRILLGVAEGPNFPSLTKAVGDWLSLRERTRAFSLALISVPFSLAVSGPIVSHLITAFNWRGTYVVLAMISLIWLPFWWWLFHDKPSDSPYVNDQELRHIAVQHAIKQVVVKTTWQILMTNKTLLVNYWGFFVFGFYLFFYMTWLPNYLGNTYHIDLKSIGWYTVIPWLTAVLFMWLSGTIADIIYNKTYNLRYSRTYPILVSQLVSALCVIPIFHTQSLTEAMIYLSLAIGFSMSANASFYAVTVDIAGKRAGTALGVMDAFFALSGFVAPVVAGYVIGLTGSYEGVFLLLAVLAISAFLPTLLFHNKKA